MKALCVLLVCCLCVLSACGGSSTPAPPPPPPTITGAWSGTVVSFSGPSAAINGNLVQGVTNPDGTILFSGSVSITGGCLGLIQISGKIFGGSFALTGSANDGSTLDVTATINATDTQITGNYTNSAGSICAADHGTFSLTKH